MARGVPATYGRQVTARHEIRALAWSLTFLPRAVPDLFELVRSLPTLPRPSGPTEPAPPYRSYPNTPGGLVLRLLLPARWSPRPVR